MKKSYLLAALIAAGAVGWIVSGQLTGGNDRETRAPAEQSVAERLAGDGEGSTLPAVRTFSSAAKEHVREVVVRGHTEALRRVVVRAEVTGKITAIAKAKGSRVKAGEIIAQVDVRDRLARLEEARAVMRQREIEFQAAEKLRDKGYRAETQYAAAAAALDAARALVKRWEIEVAQTKIRAPFDGIIDTRPVEIGDYVEAGTKVADIMDANPFLIVAQVAEQDVARLSIGAAGRARLSSGEEVEGRIRYIAATAETQTRTFRVELEVETPDGAMREGVTAELHFPVERVMAHRISPAVLTLDEDGTMGVRCVNAENVVEFFPVKLVDSSADGVWIAGLPEQIDLIVVGQEFVRQGDRVRPTLVAEMGTSS